MGTSTYTCACCSGGGGPPTQTDCCNGAVLPYTEASAPCHGLLIPVPQQLLCVFSGIAPVPINTCYQTGFTPPYISKKITTVDGLDKTHTLATRSPCNVWEKGTTSFTSTWRYDLYSASAVCTGAHTTPSPMYEFVTVRVSAGYTEVIWGASTSTDYFYHTFFYGTCLNDLAFDDFQDCPTKTQIIMNELTTPYGGAASWGGGETWGVGGYVTITPV